MFDRENFECIHVLYESLKKNRISYLETPGYALWFSFRFNDSCHHYVGFFRHKETNLVENRQTAEWKIFNSQSNVESVKDIKNTKHYVSTDFCNAAVGFKLVIFVKLWRVRKPFLLNFSHLKFNLIEFFCSKNGTCCYLHLHKWDTEQGKCIRK